MTLSPEYKALLSKHHDLDEQQVRAQAYVQNAVDNLKVALRLEIEVQMARAESSAALAAQREKDQNST